MTLTPDLIVDRRRMRNQLTLWRIVAILALIGAVLALAVVFTGAQIRPSTPHLARIKISGLITGSAETFALLQRVEKSNAQALILRIDSGGGTTAGSEALHQEIRRLATKKPVIAVIDGVGASGAYMAALAADRIVANGSGLVGSIGVIAQYPDVSKLLGTLGVKMEAVRSSPLKATPSGFEPASPEARAALEATILDTYRWFRALVKDRRKYDEAALDKVADGRIFTGRQALGLQLIDEIGGEREAVAWLESEKNIAKALPIRDYKPEPKLDRFAELTGMRVLAQALGWHDDRAIKATAEAVLGINTLDGLVSVWHPNGNN
jgi:protease IV